MESSGSAKTLPQNFKTYQAKDGVIRRLPVKLSKKIALADWALTLFEPGVIYTEKQVNEIIGQHILDFALVRRMLVDSGKLVRDAYGKEYRKAVS
jgi:hypothetical protein